jgi:hypothetical protein
MTQALSEGAMYTVCNVYIIVFCRMVALASCSNLSFSFSLALTVFSLTHCLVQTVVCIHVGSYTATVGSTGWSSNWVCLFRPHDEYYNGRSRVSSSAAFCRNLDGFHRCCHGSIRIVSISTIEH